MKQKKRLSILIVTITAFLLCTVSLYSFFIFIYGSAYSVIENAVYKSMYSEAQSILADIEKEVGNIQIRLHGIIYSRMTNILYFSNADVYDEYDILMRENDLISELNFLVSGNDYVDDVTVYFFDNGFKISASNDKDEITVDEAESIRIKISSGKNCVVDKDGNVSIFAFRQGYKAKPEKSVLPDILVVAKLSNSKLLKAMQDRSDRNILITADEGDQIITSTLSKFMTEEFKKIAGDRSNDEHGQGMKTLGGNEFFLSYVKSESMGWKLWELVPSGLIFNDLYRLRLLIRISTVLFIVIIFVFIYFIYLLLYTPIHTLINAFKKMEKGKLDTRLGNTFTSEFAMLFEDFNIMAEKLGWHIENEFTQRILIQEAELKQLQLQINPHFLYNSFFILNSMIKMENFDDAENMSRLMGTYLEFISHNKSDTIILEQEIKHAWAYADIQQIRFSKRLQFELEELPPEIKNVSVPKLIVQPLIENALQHGVNDVDYMGIIKVGFRLSEMGFSIAVEDNGKDSSDENIAYIRNIIDNCNYESSGIALYNINRRLKLKYGGGSGLSAGRSELGGIKFMITVEVT